jgi:arsenate reductase
MAAGFLASFDPRLEVRSAGTSPSRRVHPMAVTVMKEAGVEIGGEVPKSVDVYVNEPFDYVITVCDSANESCPVFSGKVGKRLHIGFDDPSFTTGTDEEKMADFRRVRDQIRARFETLYRTEMLPVMKGH